MTESKNVNIHKKLKEIQREVTALVKDKMNEFHKYKYFNEKQCLELIKPLLDKYEVAYEAKDDPSQPFIHEREGKSHFVKYLKKFILVDVNNPKDIIEFPWWTAAENNDLAKAKGSAETYAAKYFFQKAFAIPVKDENDPDIKEKSTEDYESEKVEENKVSKEQVDAFYELFKKKIDNDLVKQKAMLASFDEIFIKKYKMNGATNGTNFRMRLGLLKTKDYAELWNQLVDDKF